jgi:hypothetical protein
LDDVPTDLPTNPNIMSRDMVVTLLELCKICLGVSCLAALHLRARWRLMALLDKTLPYSGLASL